MRVLRSAMLLLLGAAVGGAVLLAYRVSRETGKSFPEAFAEVPAEAEKLWSDLRARAQEAIARGRAAYQEKQAEIDERLRETASKG